MGNVVARGDVMEEAGPGNARAGHHVSDYSSYSVHHRRLWCSFFAHSHSQRPPHEYTSSRWLNHGTSVTSPWSSRTKMELPLCGTGTSVPTHPYVCLSPPLRSHFAFVRSRISLYYTPHVPTHIITINPLFL